MVCVHKKEKEMARKKIIKLQPKAPSRKTPRCNLTWLQTRRYVASGRGVGRLNTLMHRLTIHELHSLARRALSNATDDNAKSMRRWLVIASLAIQVIDELKTTIRSITALVAPGSNLILPQAA